MKKLSSILFLVTFVNFAAFAIGAAALGGAAVSGKSEGGRYYVSDHGKLTEVSRAAYTYSLVHCYTVFTTFALAMIIAFLQLPPRKRRLP